MDVETATVRMDPAPTVAKQGVPGPPETSKEDEIMLAHPPLGDGNLTYKQVAQILGVTERYVRTLKARGELPGYRVGNGRMVRFRRADVDALLKRIPTTGGAA